MRQWIMAAAIAATAAGTIGSAAVAQSPGAVERRWQDAQQRFQQETDRYLAERDIYNRSRGGGYRPAPPPPGGAYGGGYADDDRYEQGYDPSRYYRPGTQERVLQDDDRVYAGNDGRYYCKRSDGTTGLIVGGAAGGILGNVIDGGHSRTAGTLLGAAVGALAGKSIDQNQQIRCR
jgi:hypothetical protein